MDATKLTSQLIALPSFVVDENGEVQLVEFICKYFKENLPQFKIYKQKVIDNRFNVIAYNSNEPKLIFVSHMDTVLPTGELSKRLTPQIKDGKLSGLGAVDMKSGMACSISATEISSKTDLPAMALIFDCGEEYYFEGIKMFIKELQEGKLPFKKDFKPELVVFPEPSDLKISNGCRGCIELEFTVKGKSAHAGKPWAGINAIEQAVELVGILKKLLVMDNTPELGNTTVNLAGLTGGLELDGKISIRANAIADTARVVLDIRTASKVQTADFILNKIREIAKTLGIGLVDKVAKLDLQPFILPKSDLKLMESAIAKTGLVPSYKEDLVNSGYGEFAMLGAELGWNAINFGPGPGNKSHQLDEYVEIAQIDMVSKVYCELIKNYL